MKLNDTTITTAGVFRCCFESWKNLPNKEIKIGDIMECYHCKEKFQLVESKQWIPLWQTKNQ